MADEKTKRLRMHVVKELYDTERDYTDHLEFTVTVLLERARVKGQHDNTFTESVLQKLFCNIEDILAFHRRLIDELKTCGVSYGSLIAGVYLKFKDEFLIYQHYGKGNEAAQKLLYELQDNDSFQAFFLGCLLLGGRDAGSGISSYLFKPIQRVTKYPLLFRELEKYTPHDHPDYEATCEMGKKMREVCFVINEAKRAVEKLDTITDWQASVDGWEGSKVTDTCNELIKEGLLIKISAGNTQERVFSLFDNLMVYCKKSLLSRTRPLSFRGRIPMDNLDVEDIEDGTADFLTSGITVTNSWKVHNIAKDKWFVLIAKSPEEKKEWMDAIHNEKEKRKRSQASHGRAVYKLMVAKGEKLYQQAKQRPPLMRDHKQRLRSVAKCFTGSEFVSWLVEQSEVSKEDEAIILAQHLLENGIIHHVNDKHQFKKGDLLYRFRYDDGTYRTKYASSELSARSVRMYCRLHGLFGPIIKDHRGSLMGGALRSVLNAQKLIEWLLDENDITSREEGVALGRDFIALGVLRHATDGQDFRDTNSFYRFTADDIVETASGSRRPSVAQGQQQTVTRGDFNTSQNQSCITLTVPYSREEMGYGVEFRDEPPDTVTISATSSHAQWCGVTEGLTVVAVNGFYLTSAFGRTHFDLRGVTCPSHDSTAPPPLHITVLRNSSEYVRLRPSPTGLGFHIRGSAPVIIRGVDKGSAAAQAGLLSGSCILRVGQQDVLKASHDTVVAAVKQNLQDTDKQEGGPTVELKVTFSNMEHLVKYEYVTNNHTHIQVYERTAESPYTFSLPAQLFKLFAAEAVAMATNLEGCGISHDGVTAFITDLHNVGKVYEKAHRLLLAPRFPSYKPFGPSHTSFLEGCPCNLHTSLMDVLSPSSSAPTPSSPNTTDDDSSSPVVSVDTTSYLISTMACPSLTLTKSDVQCLEDATIRRDLMDELQARAACMAKSQGVLRGFLDMLDGSPDEIAESPSDSLGFLSVHSPPANDLTPISSPVIPRRSRNASFSNPLPSIHLQIEGLSMKVEDLVNTLKSKSLRSVVDEVREMVDRSPTDVLNEFCEKLRLCVKEVESTVGSPGPRLASAVQALVDTTTAYTQEIMLFISLSLATYDKPALLHTYDKLFSQCVVALATGFAHQLVSALQGQLNPEPEYGSCSEDISSGWLQLIANKGVLFHLESIMSEVNEREMKQLHGLDYVVQQLKSVSLHLVAMESTSDVKGSLPEVTLSGSRSALQLTFALPPHLYSSLPATLISSQGVKVHPVLLNKGLYDIREGTEAYQLERSINSASLETVKSYYRQLRSYRLGRSLHRQTSEEKAQAILETAEPLHALELLSHQLEIAIREPTRPGIGLLTVAAELTTRMGAVRVCVCDSGVFRSGLACSLEQVMILVRSHQLPMKNMRIALDTIRKDGTFSTLIRKNGAEISVSLPQKPPLLYRLPIDM